MKDTIYFNSDWRKVELRESASFYRVIFYDTTKNTLIPFKDFYMSGQVQMSSQAKNPRIVPTRKNGKTVYYFENGNKKSECYYFEGKLVNRYKVWREDGSQFKLFFYDLGMLDGEQIEYHLDGKTIKRLDYYEDGKLISGKCLNEKGEETEYTASKEPPRFVGGNDRLIMYLNSRLVYPKQALEYDFEGRIVVSITVDTNGAIIESHILKSVHPYFDNEALRVIKEMPNWIPGKIEGKPVVMTTKIPIYVHESPLKFFR